MARDARGRSGNEYRLWAALPLPTRVAFAAVTGPRAQRLGVLRNPWHHPETVLSLGGLDLTLDETAALHTRALPEAAVDEVVLVRDERREPVLRGLLAHNCLSETATAALADSSLDAAALVRITASRWQPPRDLLAGLRARGDRDATWAFVVRNAWGLGADEAAAAMTWACPSDERTVTVIAAAVACAEVPGLAGRLVATHSTGTLHRGGLLALRSDPGAAARVLAEETAPAILAILHLDETVDLESRNEARRRLLGRAGGVAGAVRPRTRYGAAQYLMCWPETQPMAISWFAQETRDGGNPRGPYCWYAWSRRDYQTLGGPLVAQRRGGAGRLPEGAATFDADGPLVTAAYGAPRAVGAYLRAELGDDPDRWMMMIALGAGPSVSVADAVNLTRAAIGF